MSTICIKIDFDNKWNMRKKANLEGWDMSHLIRRLITMWLLGDVRAGKPRPIRKRFQTQALGFKVPEALRADFNVKAHAAGWTSAALIRRLLDLWFTELIDPGTPVKSSQEIKTVLDNGQEVTIYTLRQASKMLGICELTLRKRIQRDGIQGRSLKITETEIEVIRAQLSAKK